MRISPLSSNALPVGETPSPDPQLSVSQAAAELSTAEATVSSLSSLGGGLKNWNPQLNQQLANAQQALVFLDQLSGRLQSLKAELSSKLASQDTLGDQRRIHSGLKRLADLWDKRQQVAGSLSGQLAFSPVQEPRQQFKIRGLDFKALQTGEREVLSFSAAGLGQQLLTVTIEPGLSREEIVRRFNNALAAADIRASQSDQGELGFSVPESAWGALTESLAIKGAGIRFPGGQLHRARIESAPEAIDPESWQAEDVAAMRRTLQEIVNALDRIQHARQVISRALADARNNVTPMASEEELEWALVFAEGFSETMQQPDYQMFAAIAPALDSISRSRVLSLLSLRQE